MMMTPSVRRDGGLLTRFFRRDAMQSLQAALIALVLLVGAGISTTAIAQPGGIDPNTEMDGRLFGYPANVGIEKDSTTPLWFVYFFLVVVGCSALFKTAKRE
jgi:hypothetical protein